MRDQQDSAGIYRVGLTFLFGAFLLGMAVTIALSGRPGTRVVDANYYQNGLNYGRTTSGARNPGLTWTMTTSIAGEEFLVMVNDENGAPVPGGRLLFQPKRAGSDHTLHLTETAPGVFRALRPATPRGELHGTLRFTKGEATASKRVVFFN